MEQNGMHDLTFTQLSNESDILKWDLDRFAASFGHAVSRIFPIWIAHIDGKLVCYCHLHPHLIAYPAIHPDISPRDFYRLALTWFSKIKSEYGDPLVAVSQPATERLFSKVGLKPFTKELYQIGD